MRKLRNLVTALILAIAVIVPAASAIPVMAADSSWKYPMSDCYVCGNDWGSYYRARPARPYHAGLDVKSGNKRTYNGITYYNPHYVISKNKLP